MFKIYYHDIRNSWADEMVQRDKALVFKSEALNSFPETQMVEKGVSSYQLSFSPKCLVSRSNF